MKRVGAEERAAAASQSQCPASFRSVVGRSLLSTIERERCRAARVLRVQHAAPGGMGTAASGMAADGRSPHWPPPPRRRPTVA